MRRRVWDPEEDYFLRTLRQRRVISDLESRCQAAVNRTAAGFLGVQANEETKHRLKAAVQAILRSFQKEADERGVRDKDGMPYEFKVREIVFNGEPHDP